MFVSIFEGFALHVGDTSPIMYACYNGVPAIYFGGMAYFCILEAGWLSFRELTENEKQQVQWSTKAVAPWKGECDFPIGKHIYYYNPDKQEWENSITEDV